MRLRHSLAKLESTVCRSTIYRPSHFIRAVIASSTNKRRNNLLVGASHESSGESEGPESKLGNSARPTQLLPVSRPGKHWISTLHIKIQHCPDIEEMQSLREYSPYHIHTSPSVQSPSRSLNVEPIQSAAGLNTTNNCQDSIQVSSI